MSSSELGIQKVVKVAEIALKKHQERLKKLGWISPVNLDNKHKHHYEASRDIEDNTPRTIYKPNNWETNLTVNKYCDNYEESERKLRELETRISTLLSYAAQLEEYYTVPTPVPYKHEGKSSKHKSSTTNRSQRYIGDFEKLESSKSSMNSPKSHIQGSMQYYAEAAVVSVLQEALSNISKKHSVKYKSLGKQIDEDPLDIHPIYTSTSVITNLISPVVTPITSPFHKLQPHTLQTQKRSELLSPKDVSIISDQILQECLERVVESLDDILTDITIKFIKDIVEET
ncbi:hypothetical protein cand_027500 [Cryptosporidium andersoni]|uniref:Uncharacterized protein n=1 Tax=Cryptosporidium andersoni TaxID=117008 RepID=A0A1J4MR47_9CRYT|nr:hypothetical protein cand_027500 [Cryptosporidium andersoni]